MTQTTKIVSESADPQTAAESPRLGGGALLDPAYEMFRDVLEVDERSAQAGAVEVDEADRHRPDPDVDAVGPGERPADQRLGISH
jgi:hypothetical protein